MSNRRRKRLEKIISRKSVVSGSIKLDHVVVEAPIERYLRVSKMSYSPSCFLLSYSTMVRVAIDFDHPKDHD